MTTAFLACRVPLFQSIWMSESLVSACWVPFVPSRAQTARRFQGSPEASSLVWKRELDYWSGVIEGDELHPQPIVRAAIRWLYAHPPPPAQKLSVVHGDYRSGNFLHDGSGRIIAVLDWEMAHIGDPLEDLAWGLDPLWRHTNDSDQVGGMCTKADAIRIWEAASGLKVDPAAFAWWEVFASVKGQAIWISSAREYRDSGFKEPILCFSGWYTARRQDEILAEHLRRLAA